jgi:hypothetical protein
MSRNLISMKTPLLAGAAALATLCALPAAAQPSRQPALDDQLAYAAREPAKTGTFQLIPLRELVQVRGQEGAMATLQRHRRDRFRGLGGDRQRPQGTRR